MAGLSVKVVERRPVVGGAAVTEEFFPGFRNSLAAYTVSLLHPKIIADLHLIDHGLEIVERRAQNFLPNLDSSYLLAAEGRTERSIAKFNPADAERFPAFNRELDASADLMRDLVLRAPPNLTRGRNFVALGELLKAGRLGNRLRRLSTENLRTLLDLFTKSAADYLDGWFEGDLVKAWLGFDAIVNQLVHTPGTATFSAPCLRRVGKKRLWARHRQHGRDHAGRRAAASHGVETNRCRCASPTEGRAGVALADGSACAAPAVARMIRRL